VRREEWERQDRLAAEQRVRELRIRALAQTQAWYAKSLRASILHLEGGAAEQPDLGEFPDWDPAVLGDPALVIRYARAIKGTAAAVEDRTQLPVVVEEMRLTNRAIEHAIAAQKERIARGLDPVLIDPDALQKAKNELGKQVIDAHVRIVLATLLRTRENADPA
jgi:hypothetical protein